MAESDGSFLEELSSEERGALSGRRFAVCVGRFYENLAQRLVAGARHGFELAGVPEESVVDVSVPGAYELPFAARLFAQSGEFAGVACLGVVIRGETDHYDFVCGESARGIQNVQLETGVPCAFGVITCDTMEQALARAGGDKRDQGRNAALTVARMALLKDRLAA
ncbi:MAG TPA: 6,7-dimethyl-8-ribityllumazine synthase [Solirubrobacterales bacterium]|nr:6,7-dimethyl-8-ribityllumazine synthase [Solirubrobacterales bacterium]